MTQAAIKLTTDNNKSHKQYLDFSKTIFCVFINIKSCQARTNAPRTQRFLKHKQMAYIVYGFFQSSNASHVDVSIG